MEDMVRSMQEQTLQRKREELSENSSESDSSVDTVEGGDELAHLKALNLGKPVLLFPGREGTEVYPLPMKMVRSLQLDVEATSQNDFLE